MADFVLIHSPMLEEIKDLFSAMSVLSLTSAAFIYPNLYHQPEILCACAYFTLSSLALSAVISNLLGVISCVLLQGWQASEHGTAAPKILLSGVQEECGLLDPGTSNQSLVPSFLPSYSLAGAFLGFEVSACILSAQPVCPHILIF